MAVSLGSAVVSTAVSLAGLTSGLNQAQSIVKSATANMNAIFAGIGNSITGDFGAQFNKITTIFKEAGAEGATLNAELETARGKWIGFTGSAQAAAQQVQAILDLSTTSGFKFEAVEEASRKLEIFGGHVLDTKANLQSVMDVSAETSRPVAQVGQAFGRLFDALQGGRPFAQVSRQLQLMGVVSTETRTHLEGMQAQGATAAQMWDYFQSTLGRYSGAAARVATTWDGGITSLKTSVSALAAEVGKPMFDLMLSGLNMLVKALNSSAVKQFAADVATAMKGITDVIYNLITAIASGDWSKAWGVMTNAAEVAFAKMEIVVLSSTKSIFDKLNQAFGGKFDGPSKMIDGWVAEIQANEPKLQTSTLHALKNTTANAAQQMIADTPMAPYSSKMMDDFTKGFTDYDWTALKTISKGIRDEFQSTLSIRGGTISVSDMMGLDQIEGNAAGAIAALEKYNAAIDKNGEEAVKASGDYKQYIEAINQAIDNASKGSDIPYEEFQKMKDDMDALIQSTVELATAQGTAVKAADDLKNGEATLKDVTAQVTQNVREANAALKDQQDIAKEHALAFKELLTPLQDQMALVREAATASADAWAGVIEGIQGELNTIQEAAKVRAEGVAEVIQGMRDALQGMQDEAAANQQALEDKLEPLTAKRNAEREAQKSHTLMYQAILNDNVDAVVKEIGAQDEVTQKIRAKWEAEITGRLRAEVSANREVNSAAREERAKILQYDEQIHKLRAEGHINEAVALEKQRDRYKQGADYQIQLLQERASVAKDELDKQKELLAIDEKRTTEGDKAQGIDTDTQIKTINEQKKAQKELDDQKIKAQQELIKDQEAAQRVAALEDKRALDAVQQRLKAAQDGQKDDAAGYKLQEQSLQSQINAIEARRKATEEEDARHIQASQDALEKVQKEGEQRKQTAQDLVTAERDAKTNADEALSTANKHTQAIRDQIQLHDEERKRQSKERQLQGEADDSHQRYLASLGGIAPLDAPPTPLPGKEDHRLDPPGSSAGQGGDVNGVPTAAPAAVVVPAPNVSAVTQATNQANAAFQSMGIAAQQANAALGPLNQTVGTVLPANTTLAVNDLGRLAFAFSGPVMNAINSFRTALPMIGEALLKLNFKDVLAGVRMVWDDFLKISDGFPALMKTFNFTDILASTGKLATGFLDLFRGGTSLFDVFRLGLPVIGDFAKVFGFFPPAMVAVQFAIDAVIVAMRHWDDIVAAMKATWEALAPIIQDKLIRPLTELVSGTMERIGPALQNVATVVMGVFAVIDRVFQDVIEIAGRFISKLGPILLPIADLVMNSFGAMIDTLKGLWFIVLDILGLNWSKLGEDLKKLATDLLGHFGTVFEDLKKIVQNVGPAIVDGLKAAWEFLGPELEKLGSLLKDQLLPAVWNGLNAFGAWLKDTAGPAIATWFNDTLVPSVGAAFSALGTWLTTDMPPMVSKYLTDSFGRLQNLNDFLSGWEIEHIRTPLWNAIKEGFNAIKEWLAEHWKQVLLGALLLPVAVPLLIAEGILKLWPGIQDGLNSLKDSIAKKWSEIWSGVGDVFSTLGTNVRNGLTTFWNHIKEGLDEIKTFFEEHWKQIVIGALLLPFAVPILIGVGIKKLWEQIEPALNSLKESITTHWTAMWTGIGNFFGNVGSWLAAAPGKITAWFTNFFEHTLPDAIGAVIGGIFNIGLKIIFGIIDGLTTNVPKLIQWFRDLPEKIGAAFSATGTWAHALWDNLVDATKQVIADIGTFFEELPGNIGAIFSLVGTTVHDAFENIKNAIGRAWSEIRIIALVTFDYWVNFFLHTLPDAVGSAFSILGTKAREGLEAARTFAVNSFNFWVNFFEHTLPNAVGAAFSALGTKAREGFEAARTFAINSFNFWVNFFEHTLPDAVGAAFSALGTKARDGFEAARTFAINSFNFWVNFFEHTLPDAVGAAFSALGTKAHEAFDAARTFAVDTFNFYVNFFEHTLPDAAGAAFSALGTKAHDAWDVVFNTGKTVWDSISFFFEHTLPDAVGAGIQGAKDKFNGMLDGIHDAVMTVKNAVGGWFSELGTAIAGHMDTEILGRWNTFWDGLKKTINGIATDIKNEIGAAFTGLGEFLDKIPLVGGIAKMFEDLYDHLVGHSVVPDLVNRIVEEFNRLLTEGPVVIQKLIDAVANIVATLWDRIKGPVGDVAGKIGDIFGGVFGGDKKQQTDKEAGTAGTDAAQQFKDQFETIMAQMASLLTDTIGKMGESLKDMLSQVVIYLGDSLNALSQHIDTVMREIATMQAQATPTATAGTTVGAPDLSGFNSAVQSAQGVLSTVLTQMEDGLVGLTNSAHTALTDVMLSFGDMTDKTAIDAGTFGSMLTSLGTAMATLRDNAIDAFSKVAVAVGTSLSGDNESIVGVFSNMTRDIVGVLISLRDDGLSPVNDMASGMVNAFQTASDTLVGHSIVPDLVQRVTDLLQKMYDDNKPVIDAFLKVITDGFDATNLSVTTDTTTMTGNVTTLIEAMRVAGEKSITTMATNIIASIHQLSIDTVVAFGGFSNTVGSAIDDAKILAEGKTVELVDGIVGKMREMPGKVTAAIGNWSTFVVSSIDSMKGLVGAAMEDMVNTIADKFNSLINKTNPDAEKMTQGIFTWFKWLYDQLVGHSVIPDLVRDAGGWFDTWHDESTTTAGNLASGVVGHITDMHTQVTSKLSGIADTISNPFEEGNKRISASNANMLTEQQRVQDELQKTLKQNEDNQNMAIWKAEKSFNQSTDTIRSNGASKEEQDVAIKRLTDDFSQKVEGIRAQAEQANAEAARAVEAHMATLRQRQTTVRDTGGNAPTAASTIAGTGPTTQAAGINATGTDASAGDILRGLTTVLSGFTDILHRLFEQVLQVVAPLSGQGAAISLPRPATVGGADTATMPRVVAPTVAPPSITAAGASVVSPITASNMAASTPTTTYIVQQSGPLVALNNPIIREEADIYQIQRAVEIAQRDAFGIAQRGLTVSR